MKRNTTAFGHLAAIVTIIIWGTTFISTKVLLQTLPPIEILFMRFLIGFIVLVILNPRRLKVKERGKEWLFAAAGLCGITFYYLFENIALTMTTATNVGIIVTISPFFAAIFSRIFLKSGKPGKQFYIGFVAAIAGIALISFAGGGSLSLNPKGDLLAALAAITWAVYSILTKKIGELGYNTIQTTRRVFLYGLIFMVPALFFMDFKLEASMFTGMINIGNILYLGIGASAICFVSWNKAMGILGVVKTSVYIYLVPVVTMIFSTLILKEPLTPVLVAGAALTLAGLWLSERKIK